jgi:hypothetical protein
MVEPMRADARRGGRRHAACEVDGGEPEAGLAEGRAELLAAEVGTREAGRTAELAGRLDAGDPEVILGVAVRARRGREVRETPEEGKCTPGALVKRN